MDYYFDKAVSTLAAWDKNAHTIKEYRMAMLYGLNNPGDYVGTGTYFQSKVANLNIEYNSLLTKYSITPSDLTTFYLAELNASTAKKLPNNCN